MIAVGISFAIFGVWIVVGYALISSLLPRGNSVSNLLLSPAIGMGALGLAAHTGLRCESPVGPLAIPIVLSALLLALVVLAIRRPPLPWRRILPFGLIALVAFSLSGWPMFRWGGDWIANANTDMANYCQGATGFREHGFRALHVDKFFAGEDLTYDLWQLYADRFGTRHGVELTLAMTSKITTLPTPFVFMPLILAMHMALIFSVGYLFHRLADGKRVSLIVCGFMAISPLSTFGVVQQLLGQVGGLALLAAATGYYMRPARRLPLQAWLKRGLLGGILAAAFMLFYPELAPFLFAAFGLHIVVGFVRGRWDTKQFAVAIQAAILVAPLLGSFLSPCIGFLMHQAANTKESAQFHVKIFPQYLDTEGFARLWGFATNYEPVDVKPESRWPVHGLVVEGGFCLLLSLTAGIALSWRRRPVGLMLLVMAGVAVDLFAGKAAFGLFKLAMYAQPFLLGSLVLGWSRIRPGYWKAGGLLCLIALAAMQIPTQYDYATISATKPSAGGEIPGASQAHLFTQYWNAFHVPGGKRFVVPVNDVVSFKLLASCSTGVTLCIPSYAIQVLVYPYELEEPYRAPVEELLVLRMRRPSDGDWYFPPKRKTSIGMLDATNPKVSALFALSTPDWVEQPQEGDYLVEPPENFELFNRSHRTAATRKCLVTPLSEAKNYLFWQPCGLSERFAIKRQTTVGLSALQRDPAYPQATLAASGQFLSFRALNPTAKVRLLLSGTSTYIPDDFDVPPASVVGDRRVPLPMVGQGAARVVSESFSLQKTELGSFFVLDFGRNPKPPKPAEHPLRWDSRQISFYVRDVSLLSEEEYAAMAPPACLRIFPLDLSNKQLEFSGCMEEGTVTKQSWFRLTQPQKEAPLQVRGRLPSNGNDGVDPNTLIVKWNGAEIGRKTITSFEFALSFPVPPGTGPGKVELEFANSRNVSPTTTVQISAQLTFVGFEP